MTTVLAYDLGASSGRLIAEKFDGNTISIKEIHRFNNKPQLVRSHYYWDYPALIKELKVGLQKVDFPASSLGIDTWGVDIGLLNREYALLSLPFSYRDTHSEPQLQKLKQLIDPFELFKRTGNEISSINTLFQLMAIYEKFPTYRELCKSILMMPNLLLYGLSNVALNEYSISSTSQLVNHESKQWDEGLMQLIFQQQLPLASIEMPHQIIGDVLDFPSIQMALVPGHDTACALSALPINRQNALFMSLGTWCLVGKEIDKPIVSRDAFEAGFTNEGTSEGAIRFQKNAMGFWILQKLREEWVASGMNVTYDIERQGFLEAAAFKTIIDPEDPLFFNPKSMTLAIETYCAKTAQVSPSTIGEYVRCFTESVAISYAKVIKKIEQLASQSTTEIFIGGGGAQNKTLCQLIANATGKVVFAGPIEASSIGNGLSQLRALGELNSIEEGRVLVSRSFHPDEFIPQDQARWQEILEQYKTFI
ncbi:rhamnulokinase [Viridibacillus arvi]|uniref:rhamnulokinase n=1 Tax=Viridibacillus arvi TaxID=263475 RepID=UPI003D2C5900